MILMTVLGKMIPTQLLKNIFIGVGLGNNSKESREMQELADCSGKNGEFFNVDNNGIEKIFSRISLELGLQLHE